MHLSGVYALLLIAKSAVSSATNLRCTTESGIEKSSGSPVPTETSTSTIVVTSTQSITTTSSTTITGPSTTVTSDSTITSTVVSTDTPVQTVTQTVTSTLTTQPLVTITSTVTSTIVGTTVTNSNLPTITVAPAPGFTPLASNIIASGHTPGTSTGGPHKRAEPTCTDEGNLSSRESGSVPSKGGPGKGWPPSTSSKDHGSWPPLPSWPSSHHIIPLPSWTISYHSIPHPSWPSWPHSIPQPTLSSSTSTKDCQGPTMVKCTDTITSTSTVTSTYGASPATVSVTGMTSVATTTTVTSTTEAPTSTDFSTSTKFVVYTSTTTTTSKVTISGPTVAPTFYQACAANNLIVAVDGLPPGALNANPIVTTRYTSDYDCCVFCLNQPGCSVWFAISGEHVCGGYTTSVCNPMAIVNTFSAVSESSGGTSVGNTNCGQWNFDGDE